MFLPSRSFEYWLSGWIKTLDLNLDFWIGQVALLRCRFNYSRLVGHPYCGFFMLVLVGFCPVLSCFVLFSFLSPSPMSRFVRRILNSVLGGNFLGKCWVVQVAWR